VPKFKNGIQDQFAAMLFKVLVATVAFNDTAARMLSMVINVTVLSKFIFTAMQYTRLF
jgi:hypothetical protein